MGQANVAGQADYEWFRQGVVGAVEHALGRFNQFRLFPQQQDDRPPYRDQAQRFECCVEHQHGTGHG